MLLWSLRHGGGSYPVLSKENDYEWMCFWLHTCSVTSIAELKDLGVRHTTIKSYYAKEMRIFIANNPDYIDTPKEKRHWSQAALERTKKCRDERLQREMIREEVNKRSYMKLDEAIRARVECGKSVIDYYLHRGEMKPPSP